MGIVNNNILSKHQLQAIRTLKAKLFEAKRLYCEALELLMAVYCSKPTGNPSKLVDWQNRVTKLRFDSVKAFDRYNRAFNELFCYERVATGEW